MLIRVLDHFRNNPKRIDKLIAIKGLPEEWFFNNGPHGKELKKPWQPDIDANIPHDVRHVCEPTYITFRFPPIEKGQNEVIDHRQILGVRIDYNTEPGREMWDQVERYMEESIPRNERLPVPVVCAKDEHSSFETYTPRRTATGSLEFVPSPIPQVDLTRYAPQVPERIPDVAQVLPKQEEPPIQKPVEPPPAPPVEVKATEPAFVCEVCSVSFGKIQALRMHKVKKHPKKVEVKAS